MEQETQNTEVVGTNTDTDGNNNQEHTTDSEVKTDVQDKAEVVTDEKVETKSETEKEIMIPKTRFDEVNNKYKDLVNELEELKKAQTTEQPETKEEVKVDKPETVVKDVPNPQLQALEKQVESFQAVFNEMVESKIKEVPEDMRDLIPEGLTVEQKLSWINKAEEKGLFKKPQVVVGQPLNHSSEQTKTEKMKKMNPLQLLSSYYGESK